jgi:hypothetical protein
LEEVNNMCAQCGCNYPTYNHENMGMKVPMLPDGNNPLPLKDGKIPQSKTVTATPRKPKK